MAAEYCIPYTLGRGYCSGSPRRKMQERFVASGKDERFSGRLSGVVAGYEYTSAGKPMAGRIYYLQADSRTVFVLNFTGLRDKLQRIQNQTDSIARSFRLKQ